MHRTGWSFTTSNGRSNLQRQPHLFKLHPCHNVPSSSSKTSMPSLLYVACEKNDLVLAEACLKKMKLKEIDNQYPPNNETVLHLAARKQLKEMTQLLLNYGAQRSSTNAHGQQAYELAEKLDIKDLFERQKSSRFVFQSHTSTSLHGKIKGQSCPLITDKSYYGWEFIVDSDASQTALIFRHELKSFMPISRKECKQKLYSIKKGYINTCLKYISLADGARIRDYFKRAYLQGKLDYIITAYTICQNFSKILNTDMARNVVHDVKNGCSKFSCNYLYSTEDGTKSIATILLYHPYFDKLSFKGRVYRGIVMPKDALDRYKVNVCIITTTFLSTSKNPVVAKNFCNNGQPDRTKHSFFCIYEIASDDRTALDISTISEFTLEDEVLILPYSTFLITNIDEGQETTNIYLKEYGSNTYVC